MIPNTSILEVMKNELENNKENNNNDEFENKEPIFVKEIDLNLNERDLLRKNEFDTNKLDPIPSSFENLDHYKKIMRTAVLIEMQNEYEKKRNLIMKDVKHIEFNYVSSEDPKIGKIKVWSVKIPIQNYYKMINKKYEKKKKSRINVSDSVRIEWDKKFNQSAHLDNSFYFVEGKVKSIRGNILIIVMSLPENKYFPDSKLSPSSERVPYTLKFGPDLTIITRKLNAIDKINLFPIELQNIILGKSDPLNNNEEIFFEIDNSFENLNESQKIVIQKALTNKITLVQGPPGCGKTHVIASIVKQTLLLGEVRRILVVGPSNVSIENLVNSIKILLDPMNKKIVWSGSNKTDFKSIERVNEAKKSLSLSHIMIKKTQEAKEFVRLYNLSLEGNLSFEDTTMLQKYKRICEQNILKEADVVCCTSVSSGKKIINELIFDVVIIDEATQAVEPETLIPLAHDVKKFILVGDQNQLGPNLDDDPNLLNKNYNRSLFERLLLNYKNTKLFSFLDHQYRMHPKINEFSNIYFYEGKIKNGISEEDRIGIFNPISLIDVKGFEKKKETSFENEAESNMVLKIYRILKNNRIDDSQIGIISPYSAQTKLIREKIFGLEKFPKLKIASVDSFQGNERDYIIVSLTRAENKKLSNFFKDKRRANVSLTRARFGLILIANISEIIEGQHIWTDFILNCISKNYIIDFSQPENFNQLNLIEPEKEEMTLFNQNDQGFSLKEIKSSITDSHYKIIWPCNQHDLEYLEAWKIDILRKLDNNEFVNLAFDCESICLQFGEIFNNEFDIFNLTEISSIPEIGSCEGVLVLFYDKYGKLNSESVTNILSPIINHPKITLITFDFTYDISKLYDLGFNPSLNRIFDSQTFSIDSENENLISFTNVKPLSDLILLSNNQMDNFIINAQDWVKKNGKDFPWDVNQFIIEKEKLSPITWLTEDFLLYASNDIPLTALACKFVLTNYKYYLNCLKQTKRKIEEFVSFGPNIAISIREAEFLRQEIPVIMNYNINERVNTRSLILLWRNHQKLLKLLSLKNPNIEITFRLNFKDIEKITDQKNLIEKILNSKINELLKVRKLHSPNN